MKSDLRFCGVQDQPLHPIYGDITRRKSGNLSRFSEALIEMDDSALER